MASLHRTIKRAAMFRKMNKQQRRLWKAQHGSKANSNLKHVNGDFVEQIKKGA